MKYLVTILLAAISCAAFAQDKHFVPKDKRSDALYISNDFCNKRGLEAGESNELLRAWNNLDNVNNTKVFSRVVDIRWYFSTPEEAKDYLANNITELSEKADEVKTPITIPYASNVRIFKDGESVKLSIALGLSIHLYFFLFTEKNYIAKVFVSTEKDIPVGEAAVFAIEAAQRLNTAIK